MGSLLQPADYFSLQKQNVSTSLAPAPAAPWYAEDKLSDCSLLPSPISEDVVTPSSTDLYLDPLSLSSNFNDYEYNSISLFDNIQMQGWLSDPDQDLNISSPFSMAVASPLPQRKHEPIDIDHYAAEFQRYPGSFSSSSSPPTLLEAGIARDFSQDLSLSAVEVQRLTAIALGHLPPPSPSSSPNLKPSQNLQKTETAIRRPSKTEVTTTRQPPKSDRKRSGGRATVKSPASKSTTSKSSHNQVKKNYRTNLNSKFAALRGCIPNLRAQSVSDGDEAEEQDDRPVSKARILTAAVKLIETLENELEVQKREAAVLRSIVQRYYPKAVESVGLYM